MRLRVILGTLTAFALVAAVGLVVFLNKKPGHVPRPSITSACTVQADGRVSLDPTQMANAATIAAVGIRRGVPDRAVVIALATALQESKLENLASGDRDSLGLFQQRPSQGWGKPEEISDPRYSAGRFYTALLKVKGWQNMRLTEAAQRVQRSAYPDAYEKWSDESTVLANALLGRATGAVACSVPGDPQVRGDAAAAALTKQVQLDWGNVAAAPPGDLAGLALSVTDTTHGWQYAHWLVSHAAGHGLKRVRYDSLEWTAKGGIWAKVSPDAGAGTERVIAEVYAN